MTLFFGFVVLIANAQPTNSGETSPEKSTFEANMFLGQREKVNLMLAVRQPKRVTIRLKDARHAVLYRESLRKAPANHWRKFNFEGMKTGTYYLEISSGQQVMVRQIEVGLLPATQPQRFISYVPAK
ncbi:hypothetical protein ACFPMF_08080 [Larkinella bovis]|uniref:T9SS type A sorting domain-containing protein n=1 Tax=Larkinella bovis TaxID=683041 RepID=A0ABW0I9S3_9BACT